MERIRPMQTDHLDGYYWNSIIAWRNEALKHRRQMMARYASLERQSHPCKYGQGRLLDIQRRWIETLDAELAMRPSSPSAKGADDE